LPGPVQRLFESACGACHHDGDGPEVLGLNQPLALNTNLHSERPDNLIRTVLEGIWQPAYVEIGHMPGFGQSLDDQQIAELVAYMRQRFAPDRSAWTDLTITVARLRAAVR
jgi:nicotinate dehydrogenase subunit B